MTKQKLILIGGGGHCKSVIDIIETEKKYQIIGIIDSEEKIGERLLGYPIIGSDNDLERLSKKDFFFLVTVGHIKTAKTRKTIFEKLKNLNAKLAKIISPFAYVSSHATIGDGSIIMHQAFVNAGAIIGENCIINTKAIIEHDVKIESHCHISTGAIINGDCDIKKENFIGSNSVVIQGKTINYNTIIGAGAVVTKNIPSNSIITGNPGKSIN